MPSNTAALLFLHTTPHHLGWWIAHHLAVGFSSILIYDALEDTEDAYQIRNFVRNASAHYDVRLLSDTQISQTKFSSKSEKQDKAFSYLLKQAGNDFSWLLPLSIDEYFWTEENSVQNFLNAHKQKIGNNNFQNLTIIPINWCILTSNNSSNNSNKNNNANHINIFHCPFSLAAPIKISYKNFPDHRITRSFFRPYLEETPIPSPLAHLSKAANWSSARILHEAASSAQGYAKIYYQQTETDFSEGQKFLLKTQNIASELLNAHLHGLIHSQLFKIEQHYKADQFSKLTQSKLNQITSEKTSEKNLLLEHAYITHLNALLVINHQTRKLTWRPQTHLDPHKETPLCLAYHHPDKHQTASPAWLYAQSPLPYSFLTLKETSHLYIEDLLPLIALEIIEIESPSNDSASATEKNYQFMALSTNKPLQFLGAKYCQLKPITDDSSLPYPFLALAYLLRDGFSVEKIINSLPNLPFLCPGSFASSLISAIKYQNKSFTALSEKGLISCIEKATTSKASTASTQPYLMESPFVFQTH